jgi:D-alanyl-D-alanine carboxypeptidase
MRTRNLSSLPGLLTLCFFLVMPAAAQEGKNPKTEVAQPTPVGIEVTTSGRADPVDRYISKQMQRQHIPALSLAVVKDGKIIKAKGYGLANLETHMPATPDTVYQLASVTKQFTATAIMLLVQDGKLTLDDKISLYVEKGPDTWKEITIRHLLTHTSGIKDYLKGLLENSREDTTPEKIIQLIAGLPLNFAPGEGWDYSNTNYLLLGKITHKVTGKPFHAFLTERVFKPLGMNATRLTSFEEVILKRAAGYVWTGDKWQNSRYLNPTVWDNGSGGMLSTVEDLAKWDAALYGNSILKESVKQQMWTAVRLQDGKTGDYGFGWGVVKVSGHRLVEANGGRSGTATNFARYVDDKVTIILLMNGGAEMGLISRGVARHYIATLNFAKPLAGGVRADRLTEYSGRYEFANNYMLTITQEKGKLVVWFPGRSGGDWLPESETTFFSEELPLRITFDRNAHGKVIGLTWKSDEGEKKIPRVGPLIHTLNPQTDPDTALTRQIEVTLKAFTQGSKAIEEVPGIAPLARRGFASGGPARADWWATLGVKSIAFVGAEDVADRRIERYSGKVSRILYYKLHNDKAPQYLLVYLTATGLVTDVDVVND